MFLEQFPSRTFYNGSNSRYSFDWLVLNSKIMERERLEIPYIPNILLKSWKEGGLEISNSKYSRYIVDRLDLEISEIMERGEIRNREFNIFQVYCWQAGLRSSVL